MKRKPPIDRVALQLYIESNEAALRKEPQQLYSGYNMFIAHESAPSDGFTITGDPLEFTVDDITGRKETFRLLIKNQFRPQK